MNHLWLVVVLMDELVMRHEIDIKVKALAIGVWYLVCTMVVKMNSEIRKGDGDEAEA